VTPVALFRNTRIPVLARWCLLLFDSFAFIFRPSSWCVKFALVQACRSGVCECYMELEFTQFRGRLAGDIISANHRVCFGELRKT
jgi:hypothetical protein